MKVEALIKTCMAGPYAILVIPKPKTYRWGDRIRLAGRQGPFGRVLNVREAGDKLEVCAHFNSPEILKWMVDSGMVKIASRPETQEQVR